MNININFTNLEMTKFLEKRCYRVIPITIIKTTPCYHNNIKETEYASIIAFKENFISDFESECAYHYNDVTDYVLEKVFSIEMKKTLLRLD